MKIGIGRSLTLVLGLFSLAAFLGVEEGAGQTFAIGGHISVNKGFTEDFDKDMSWGAGVRAHLSLPLTGLTIQGTADFYNPDCGAEECDLKEVGLNLLFSLPVPFVVKPYFGLGLAAQIPDYEAVLEDDKDYGTNFLAGVILGGPTFSKIKPFVEFKYQKMPDVDGQSVVSGGILIALF